MLPRLSNVPQLNNVVSDYLNELQKQHFEGDIASNYADIFVNLLYLKNDYVKIWLQTEQAL